MFRQGDHEKVLNQPISPLMDRTKGGVTKSQCGFFNIVALPIFSAFAQSFPAASEMLVNLTRNFDYWSAVEAAAAAAKSQAGGTLSHSKGSGQ